MKYAAIGRLAALPLTGGQEVRRKTHWFSTRSPGPSWNLLTVADLPAELLFSSVWGRLSLVDCAVAAEAVPLYNTRPYEVAS